jgi:hypothetical protein
MYTERSLVLVEAKFGRLPKNQAIYKAVVTEGDERCRNK